MGIDAETGNRKGSPNYPADFKRYLASEACIAGISVSTPARQQAINTSMLFKWRHELRADLFDSITAALLPLLIKPTAPLAPVRPASGYMFVFWGAVRRYDQSDVVELRWPVLAGQAAGAQQLRLAAGHQRHGIAILGPVVDAARRH